MIATTGLSPSPLRSAPRDQTTDRVATGRPVAAPEADIVSAWLGQSPIAGLDAGLVDASRSGIRESKKDIEKIKRRVDAQLHELAPQLAEVMRIHGSSAEDIHNSPGLQKSMQKVRCPRSRLPARAVAPPSICLFQSCMD